MKISPQFTRSTGEWSRQLNDWVLEPPASDSDGDVYVAAHHHSASKFDGTTGELEWKVEVGDKLSRIKVLDSETVLVSSAKFVYTSEDSGYHSRELKSSTYALDTEDGDVKWSFQNHAHFPGLRELPDGNVFGVTAEGHLQALSSDDGQVVWTGEHRIDRWTDIQLTDTGIVYQNPEEQLVSVDSKNGRQLWNFSGGDRNALVGSYEKAVVVRSEEPGGPGEAGTVHLHGVDPKTGEQLWKRSLEGYATVDATAHDQERLLIQSVKDWDKPEARLVSLDPVDGSVQWETEGQYLDYLERGPSGEIIGNRTADMVCLDPKNGRTKWERPGRWSVATVERNNLVLSTKTTDPDTGRAVVSMMRVDPESGQDVWDKPLTVGKHGRGVFSSADGRYLGFNLDNCKMLCVDAGTGHPVWNLKGGMLRPEQNGDRILAVEHGGELNVIKLGPSKLAQPGDGGTLPGYDPDRGPEPLPGGFSGFRIFESESTVRGQNQKVVVVEEDGDGSYHGFDYLLTRDIDGDGDLSNQDLEQMPSLETLAGFDEDGDGQLDIFESRAAGLYLWRDRNRDGELSENELIIDMSQTSLGWVDMKRGEANWSHVRRCEQ